jgi:pimeloyl-ACP methyl ester carboxylesterase
MTIDRMTGPKTRFARDPAGRRIAYAVHGDGPILMCPSWWISQVEADWDDPHFRAFFGALGESFTVVRYDQPGVGLSDRGDTVADLDDAVGVLDAVVDAIGAEKMSLFGISAGGPISVAYAARWPERIERIAMFGSFVRGADVGEPEVQEAVLKLVGAHWGLGSRTLTDIFVPDTGDEVTGRFLRRQREYADAPTAHELLQFLFALDASEDAAQVVAPTLVAHRRGDRAVPVEAGRRLAASVPDAEFVTLDGRIHPPWEAADELLELLLDFLSAPASRSTVSQGCRLDESARELVIDGERIGLTPLEHGLLTHLIENRGAVATRDELLREVWNQAYGGSNVVDAVVASVRKKLGRFSPSVETVIGHGYRFAGFVE